jgi:hypothetical protein
MGAGYEHGAGFLFLNVMSGLDKIADDVLFE